MFQNGEEKEIDNCFIEISTDKKNLLSLEESGSGDMINISLF